NIVTSSQCVTYLASFDVWIPGLPPFVRVIPARERGRMTEDEVIDQARAEGFELVERPVGDTWCWGFVREERGPVEGYRYPAFLERRQAISYMADWLRRGRVFA